MLLSRLCGRSVGRESLSHTSRRKAVNELWAWMAGGMMGGGRGAVMRDIGETTSAEENEGGDEPATPTSRTQPATPTSRTQPATPTSRTQPAMPTSRTQPAQTSRTVSSYPTSNTCEASGREASFSDLSTSAQWKWKWNCSANNHHPLLCIYTYMDAQG